MLSVGSASNFAWAQSAPPLASAQSFVVLAGSTVTNAGPTVISGDVGVSPGTAVTGFPPGTVTGGTIDENDATAVTAEADAQTAYSDLVAESCGTNLSGQILGTSPAAVTLPPGVYFFNSSAQLTGTLTLSGNGVYVFQIGSTLTTASNSFVVLANGATAGNVFWQVGSSGTFGTNTTFVGSILAFASVTVTAGTNVAGRVIALTGAVTLDTNGITAETVVAGRWEIVHTSGDNTAQSSLYPGSFSTYLREDGSGYTYGTFADSICAIDRENANVTPSWIPLGGNAFQITITVDNLGLGPNFSFIYNGTYSQLTSVPGNASEFIPAISGTYYGVGDVSGCNLTSQSNPGNFVATFLPTISSGSASGSLDGFTADNASAFDSAVDATIAFSAPPAPGQIAGTVSLAFNPTFNYVGCFATTNGVVTPLTVNPNKSSQSGVSEYMFADGLDPNGVPTTLFLNDFSANLYTTDTNTDSFAMQITATEWAAAAAIGEDNPAVGAAGVSSDGTNSFMVLSYGVLGGACNGTGGVDAPFHFDSLTPGGQGSLAPTATLSASNLAFTPQVVDSIGTTQTIRLTNYGNSTLAIASIAATGTNATDFAVTTTCGILLAAGMHCSISATFTATSSGIRIASIAITDSASGSPQSVDLRGTGQDFSLSLTSPSGIVLAGNSTNLQLTITPFPSFTDMIVLSCSGVPAVASCTITPSAVIPGSSAITVNIILMTSDRKVAVRYPRPTIPFLMITAVRMPMLSMLFTLALGCAVLRLNSTTRKAPRGLVFGGFVILISVALAACAGTVLRPAATTSSNPTGTYSVTISGIAGSLTRTATLQLKGA